MSMVISTRSLAGPSDWGVAPVASFLRAVRLGLMLALHLALLFAMPARAADDGPWTEAEAGEVITLLETMMMGRADYAWTEEQARAAYPSMRDDLGEDSHLVIGLERIIVLALVLQGKTEEAEALGLRMMQKVNRVVPADAPLAYRAASVYALTLQGSGNLRGALGLLAEAVTQAEQYLPADEMALADLRMTQARVALSAGAVDLAVVALEALDRGIAGRSDEAALFTRSVGLLLLAETLMARGEYAAALARQDAAIAAMDHQLAALKAPRMVPARLAAFVKRAELQVLMGAQDRVLTEAPAMLAEIEAHYGADSGPWADLAFVLAVAMVGDDDTSPRLPQAAELLSRVVAQREATLGTTSLALIDARVNYAMALAALGRGEEAVGQIRLLEGNGPPEQRGQLTYALYRATETGALTTEEAVGAMLVFLQRSRSSGAAVAQNRLAERLAAGPGPAADLLRARTDARDHRAEVQADLALLAAQPLEERDMARVAERRAALTAATREVERVEAALAALDPGLLDATGRRALPLEAIRAALPDDAALVLIDPPAGEGDAGIVIAVSRTAVDWHTFQGEAAEVEAAVATLRGQIGLPLGLRAAAPLDGAAQGGAPQGAAFDLDLAHWLYRETFGQVAEVTAGKRQLFVDLRGVMAALPPHLLVASAPAPGGALDGVDWLVRHHAVTVLPAITALEGAARPDAAPDAGLMAGDAARDAGRDDGRALLAFADPDFGTLSQVPVAPGLRAGLAPLPETVTEVRAVAESLGSGETSLRLGTEASEAAVKSADLEGVDVLYFATHGLVSGDFVAGTEVSEPALALTGGQGEDGFLTASEVARLRLAADVVVMSACNTAVGDSPDAEALSGLAQSFLYAGARGLLVSHWPVDSRAAVDLMTDTFRIRAETPGLGLAEAQRRAMLAMADGAPRWRHPAYWAPFVLVGGG